MVTVPRANGLHVVIYLNNHQPAHVHVFGDGEAKVNLAGSGGAPDLVWADGMTRAEVCRAKRLVAGRQAFLLQPWEDGHGRIDERPG